MKTFTRFKNDPELFDFIKKHLYVAAVCDILDELGYRNQAMHHRLRPLLPDMHNCGFVGRARTILWLETNEIMADDPYGMEIEAIDSLREGDVAVHSTDERGTNAPWGELMSTIAKQKKVAGCVCDSQVRDCVKIIEMNFPVYYTGIRPLDSKGRGIVTAYDIPIMCGDVMVNAGDLIYADFDGIIVVPAAVEQQAIEMAIEKVSSENSSRKELLQGKSLREVYDKYKVL
ncbi:MAG: RraA family protein [Chitinophagaceae bacterium]|nr:RraA family protein [Chitinophagaceae bacterium]